VMLAMVFLMLADDEIRHVLRGGLCDFTEL
jgi:hypothetical protein